MSCDINYKIIVIIIIIICIIVYIYIIKFKPLYLLKITVREVPLFYKDLTVCLDGVMNPINGTSPPWPTFGCTYKGLTLNLG